MILVSVRLSLRHGDSPHPGWVLDMTHRIPALLIVALAGAIVLSALSATPAAAAERQFALFGSRTAGWGVTNTSLQTPGPDLLVDEGDNVTLILNATDGRTHNWYIDYDNDTRADANEPTSPDFPDGQGVAVTWNFTADRNGTFIYRSDAAPQDEAAMWGNITIRSAGAPPTPTPSDSGTVVLLAAGVVVAIVVGLLLVAMVRRKQAPPPPQP